jgi:tRNA (guanine37-N1)-methyltransferase
LKVQVITLFPGMLEAPLAASMVGIARERGALDLRLVQLRDFCMDKHHTADDTPYGGGGGMVLKAEPIGKAVMACKAADPDAKVIYLSPQGKRLDHAVAARLAASPGLILLCGRYEGADQRALDRWVDEEISLGDFVLSGGELPAACLVEAVARLLPGVLGNEGSAPADSFFDGLLDFPHYTKPAEVEGRKVPEVLLSGDHARIAAWRREEALKATFFKRPDLLEKVGLSARDRQVLEGLGWKEGKER